MRMITSAGQVVIDVAVVVVTLAVGAAVSLVGALPWYGRTVASSALARTLTLTYQLRVRPANSCNIHVSLIVRVENLTVPVHIT